MVEHHVGGASQYVNDGRIHAPFQQPQIGLLSGLFVYAQVDLCHFVRRVSGVYLWLSVICVYGLVCCRILPWIGFDLIFDMI